MNKIKNIANDIIRYIKENYDSSETILFDIKCNDIKQGELIGELKNNRDIANVEIVNNQIMVEFYQ